MGDRRFPGRRHHHQEPAEVVDDDARFPDGRRRVRSGDAPVADAEHLRLGVEPVVVAAAVAGPNVVAVLVARVRVRLESRAPPSPTTVSDSAGDLLAAAGLARIASYLVGTGVVRLPALSEALPLG